MYVLNANMRRIPYIAYCFLITAINKKFVREIKSRSFERGIIRDNILLASFSLKITDRGER